MRSHEDAVDAEDPAKWIEMPVVVQDREAALGCRSGDQVVGRWQATLAGELARGPDCSLTGCACDGRLRHRTQRDVASDRKQGRVIDSHLPTDVAKCDVSVAALP